MRILITGAGGALGHALAARLGKTHRVAALRRGDLDVTTADWPAVLRRYSPDRVAHLAAWTDVDGCERDPERAFAVNAVATARLATACAARGTGLLLMSSIAVFDGCQSTPYGEHDEPNPANVYGASKLRAEHAAHQAPDHYIVRSGWLFGGGPRDKKFVARVQRRARRQAALDVVDDCVGSPTHVDDLAAGIGRLLAEHPPAGVYHLVNDGPPVSRFALAQEIVRLADLDVRLRPVSSDSFPELAPRPRMEAACSRWTAGWLRPWPAALADYVAT